MCVLALGVMGCSETSSPPPDDSPYASKDLWLCRPDIEDDYCDTADLSTTEIRPDGTMVVMDEIGANPDADVDCFYVYPTVNLSPEPGNTEILVPHPESDIGIVTRQAGRYRGVCRVFAPLYHQMSLITYWEYPIGTWQSTDIFQRAYDDVVEAFEYYMRHDNRGRGFVLLGHSQGSHMLARLLEDKFDDNETLREQLVSAVLTGPTNRVQVLEGELVGGSFTNIPLCTSANQTGCVIAFDANPAGVETHYDTSVFYYPPSARACTNPASLDDGWATLAAFVFQRSHFVLGDFFPARVDTEWVRYPNIYVSHCADADEFHVLLVDVASDYMGEVPITPQEIQDIYAERGSNRNLHGIEDYLTYADLLHIVEQQIAGYGN